MSALNLRRAVPDDAPGLSELSIASFVEAFGRLYTEADLQSFLEAHYSVADWAHEIADTENPVWVAQAADGHLVGYAQAGPCTLPVADMPIGALQLQRLYTHPDRQSAGIGAALMAQVLGWVDRQGRPALFLGVWSGNTGAQRFYARYGFSKVGEYDFPVGEQLDREHILRRD